MKWLPLSASYRFLHTRDIVRHSCACQQPTRFDWLSAHGHALLANQIVTHHPANQDAWTFGTTRRLNAVSDKQRSGVTQRRYQGFIFSESCPCLLHRASLFVRINRYELSRVFSNAELRDFAHFGCLYLLLGVDSHILFTREKCNIEARKSDIEHCWALLSKH